MSVSTEKRRVETLESRRARTLTSLRLGERVSSASSAAAPNKSLRRECAFTKLPLLLVRRKYLVPPGPGFTGYRYEIQKVRLRSTS